ncbi:regulator of nonsense transcripts 2-like isoform X2 [Watersipora subatra]|uniref:regulator of nonsense transcripts 2-like isoform X2 n=1 Tax=Watersipora subatra TaxID=2589382 RepID=UPI00355C817F
MDSSKGGKRYSTERQERLKNVQNLSSSSSSTKPEQNLAQKVPVSANENGSASSTEAVESGDVHLSLEKEVEERQAITEYVKEMEEKYGLRAKYKERNAQIEEHRPDEDAFVRLDSSLKKNTAFVRKLKSYTESQKDGLMKEIMSLNLTKYISEVATAIVETKLKMSDIPSAIEVCCLLHERYAEFADALLDNWQKVLLQKKDDKVTNQSKFRVDLRFFAELVSVGILPEKGSLNTLSNQLNILINYDKDEHNNVSIIQSFCRHCGSDYAGLVPRKYRVLAEKYNLTIPSCPTLPAEKQRGCRNLLKDYYNSLCNQLQKEDKDLQYMEWQNRRIILTKGELNADRQEKYDHLKSSHGKLLSNVQTLSDLVDEEICELVNHKFGGDDGDIEFSAAQEFHYDGDTSLYEDEETQQFYEKLADLKATVPQILLRDSQPSEGTPAEEELAESPSKKEKEEDLKVEDVEQELLEGKEEADKTSQQDEELQEELHLEEGEMGDTETSEDTVEVATTSKLMFDKFLQDLSNCVNRELIDRAAHDFCMTHNTKRNRKRLAKHLFAVPRTRYDLLPFYSRLVATLDPCMPDVSSELCKFLILDFRWLVRKKDQIKIESKIKCVRFMGELVKFGVFPKTEVLKCLKMLMFEFSHHNIDMACAMLESCGRYLYRSPDSHHRTRVYLEVMMRKKAVLSLDTRYNTMIDNAFYFCNPPSNQNIIRERRPPKHEYIRKLLYKDLNKLSTEKVLRQMRKLEWKDEEMKSYASSAIMAVWNVKYGNIHCVANLLAGLASYHEDVIVQVVDGVLEDIRLGMEMNHPKYNQRRLAVVKFLGELYNYRLVDSAVIFKTLYSFITFGVSYDKEVPSLLDPPPHLFRLRLTCCLLDTCGQYFDRGSTKRKLDYFLIYFQKYLWYKKASPHWDMECPFPMNVDMVVKDSLEAVRPKEVFAQSYLEANQNVEKLNEEFKEKLSGFLPFVDPEQDDEGELAMIQEVDENLSGSQVRCSEEEEASPSQPELRRSYSRSQSQEPDNLTASISDVDNLTASPEQELEFEMKQKGPKLLACQEDDDFLAAFDKMLVDNIQQRSQEAVKVMQADITVPVNFKFQSKKPFVTAKGSMVEEESPTSPPPKFALMTKKGNKPQFATLDLNVSQQFVVRYREREMEEKAEKQRLKELVLEMNVRQEEEEIALLEAGKSLVPNTNREKKIKYQHQKGAPDADLIFGSGPKNFTKR